MADERPPLVLVGCNGAFKGRVFSIRKFPCTLGRAPGNDVPLTGDGCASSRHCRIDCVDGKLWLEDLGSKNGTYLNGARISGRRELVPGQSILCVGQTRLSLVPPSGPGREQIVSGTQSIMLRGSVIVPGAAGANRRAEETLMVMDLCDSTALAHRRGEAAVCRCVALLTEAVEASPAGRRILFLKCTGDGFFAAFPDVEPALQAARCLLDWIGRHAAQADVPELAVRVGIHRGEVQADESGDRLGLAANLVFRLQAAAERERVEAPAGAAELPARNRILLTAAAADRLPEPERANVRPIGRFLFKGFDSAVEVCLLS